MRNTEKHVDNRGFSLIEIILALAIFVTMSSALMIGIGVYLNRNPKRYADALKDEINLARTTAMTKTGEWRLVLYRDTATSDCYSILETSADPGAENAAWTQYGNRVRMGSGGAVTWTGSTPTGDTQAESGESGRQVIHIWTFDPDTGACTGGFGSITIRGSGADYKITVYETNGYCEVERL
jgi:prepilin-type N-terminal cleavage/methylation domain-containing protein